MPVAAQNSNDNWMPGMPGMHDPGHMMDHEIDEESIIITTDVITIMAMEDIPAFQFWYTDDANGTQARFMTSYGLIAEFEDANGDGAVQFNETTHFAPLSSYEWTIQSGEVQNEDGQISEIWLKYTKGPLLDDEQSDWHHMPGMHEHMGLYEDGAEVEWFEDVTIQIWAHIYMEEHTGSVTDTKGASFNYTVAGGTEMKIDIEIGNFPFSSPTAQVTVQTMLHESMSTGHMFQENHMFRTHEENHNTIGTSAMNWTTSYGNETRFHDIMGSHMEQIDFIDTISNETQGFYKWLDQALISWPGGETEIVNVTASYVPTGMGLSLFFAYPNFGNGSLLHDPSIGLIESAAPSVLGLDYSSLTLSIVLIASVVSVVFVIRRFR
jgi:hypothetical protein